jgi:hypothetical protein
LRRRFGALPRVPGCVLRAERVTCLVSASFWFGVLHLIYIPPRRGLRFLLIAAFFAGRRLAPLTFLRNRCGSLAAASKIPRWRRYSDRHAVSA